MTRTHDLSQSPSRLRPEVTSPDQSLQDTKRGTRPQPREAKTVASPPELNNYYKRACGAKTQHKNSGNNIIVNGNSPARPHRGPTLHSLCAGKGEKQNRHGSLGTNSRRGLVLPPELNQIPPSRFTRAQWRTGLLPYPRRALRCRGWSRPVLEEMLSEGESPKLSEPECRCPRACRHLRPDRRRGWAPGRSHHLGGSTQHGDRLP